MDKQPVLPITLVIATKLAAEDFLSQTATGRSIGKFGAASNCNVQLYAENSKGLGELYNNAIEQAIQQDEASILVFLHDDVLIADYFWGNNVRVGLEKFDVVGIAGNTRRLPGQPGWIMTNLNGELSDWKYLSGAIGQGLTFPPERLDVFGPAGIECKLLDGVFLAATSQTLKNSNLRFDPQFSFHFYDLDFCRTAEILGLKMGTIPLSLVHQSQGSLDYKWHMGYETYIKKWGS